MSQTLPRLTWNESVNQRGHPVIRDRFGRTQCQACPSYRECTKAQSQHGRSISLLPYPQHVALKPPVSTNTPLSLNSVMRHVQGLKEPFLKAFVPWVSDDLATLA